MTNPSFEASSSGLKLSYLRFVSDSAPGFALLLLLGFFWQDSLWWAQHREFKVLFAALSFFLATPVGLAINAVSYFLLGQIQTQINRICFLSRGWPVRDTRRSLMLEETTAHFGFTANDWAERNDVYGELVESYRPDLSFRIEHLRGLKRFARSIALLSLICFFCLRPLAWCSAIAVIAIVTLWFTWIWIVSRREPKPEASFLASVLHELWIVILLAVLALIASARVIGVTCQTVDVALAQICTLAIALLGLLVAGMVDFFQRATIAMQIYIESTPTIKGIRDVLSESAKRLRT
jgi:hypothetical protein